MSASDLAQVIEQDHQADDAFAKGDPGPKKALYSRRGDAVLANPLLPPARGWAEVEKALDYAASGLAPAANCSGSTASRTTKRRTSLTSSRLNVTDFNSRKKRPYPGRCG